MAGICDVLCHVDVPTPYVDLCKEKTRRGGIGWVGVMPCDISTDLTIVADVAAAIAAGEIIMLPAGLGSKALPGVTKKKQKSCQPERSIGIYDHTLVFKTMFIDNVAASDYAFFNTLLTSFPSYRFFYVDCNDQIFYNPLYVTGSATIHSGIEMAVDGGEVIPEDGDKDVVSYELTFTWSDSNAVIKGHIVAGIAAALGIS